MNARLVFLFSVSLLGFLPAPAFAQCKNQNDRHCWNLQYILYAAQTDFRELRGVRGVKQPRLDASVGAAQVPCHPDTWLNNVAMYMCYAELPAADGQAWYAKTMADLQQLQYSWQFKVESSGTDHYVDAGPPGCEVAPQDGRYITDGPYVGQCPFHLQTVRQTDGSDEVSLWVTSYASPYLVRNPYVSPSGTMQWAAKAPAPAPQRAIPATQTASPAAASTGIAEPTVATSTTAFSQAVATPTAVALPPATLIAEASPTSQPATSANNARKGDTVCDDLCQGLKKVLDDRRTAFRLVNSANNQNAAGAGSGSAAAIVKLSGSSHCTVNSAPPPTPSANDSSRGSLRSVASRDPSAASPATAQYVCYWPEDSAAAAQSQFRGLISLLQTIIPAYWSSQEQDQTDELSGAKMTVWSVQDSARKPVVRLYLSGESVGLHVDALD